MADPRRPSLASLVLGVGLALVTGLVLGGLGPRAENRVLQARVADLQERTCDRRSGTRIFSEVLRPPGSDRGPPVLREREDPNDAPDAPVPSDPSADPPRVERMKEVLDLRRAQAAAALRDRAGADDAQVAEVDEITARMNEDLRALAEEFVATAQQSVDGMPTRREAMIFAADALDILIDTEEALWAALDTEQAAEVDPEILDPTAYIDGAIVDVMAQLDGR